jgi:hypothetical protein
MSEIFGLQVIVILCATSVVLGVLRLVRRYVELRRQQPQVPPRDMLHERLDRMELSIDTMAVEIERISESNRFVAKLLAERGGAVTAAKSPERVITPH